jgi:hypothetical protein
LSPRIISTVGIGAAAGTVCVTGCAARGRDAPAEAD